MDLIVGQLSERKEEYNQFDEVGAALSTCQKSISYIHMIGLDLMHFHHQFDPLH